MRLDRVAQMDEWRVAPEIMKLESGELNQPVREALTNDAWRIRFRLGPDNEDWGFRLRVLCVAQIRLDQIQIYRRIIRVTKFVPACWLNHE